MISEYKTIQYNLENTENLTIAELISKLKELPQEDLCDDYYLTFRGDRVVSKEDQVKEIEDQLKNINSYLVITNNTVNSYKKQIELLETKLKELENNDSN